MNKIIIVVLAGMMCVGCGAGEDAGKDGERTPRLTRSSSLRMMSDVRQVWMMLYMASTDRLAVGESGVWPKTGVYVSSTEYFRACAAKGWLEGLPLKLLSTRGLGAFDEADPSAFASIDNAWCVTLDCNNVTQPETPIMFSRNIKFDPEADGDPALTIQDVVGIEPDGSGLGGGYAVWVRMNGACCFLKEKKFTREKFLEGSKEARSFLRP